MSDFEQEICTTFVFEEPTRNVEILNRDEVQIRELKVLDLIDTGAMCSIISKTLPQKVQRVHPSAKVDIVGVENVMIRAVDERQFKLRGKLNANICVNNHLWNCDLFIIEKCSYDLILGQNVLEQSRMVILDDQTRKIDLISQSNEKTNLVPENGLQYMPKERDSFQNEGVVDKKSQVVGAMRELKSILKRANGEKRQSIGK